MADPKLGIFDDFFSSIKLKDLKRPDKIHVVDSKSTVSEVCELLTRHGILSAPVRNAEKPEGADWTDKYLGVVSMLDILVFVLNSFENSEEYFRKDLGGRGAFIPLLNSAKKFGNIPISNIMDEDRTPFMPISEESSVKEAMMLMSRDYHLYRLMVVSGSKIVNILTQTDIVKLLHDNLHRFDVMTNKTLQELGLVKDKKIISVKSSQSAVDGFKLIQQHRISSVPVIGMEGLMIGNLSVKDARLVVNTDEPAAFQLIHQSLNQYLPEVIKSRIDVVPPVIVSLPTDTLASVVSKLVKSKIHRIWVVNDGLKISSVLSLTDIIDVFLNAKELSPSPAAVGAAAGAVAGAAAGAVAGAGVAGAGVAGSGVAGEVVLPLPASPRREE